MFQLESLLQVAGLANLGSQSKTTDIASVRDAIIDINKLRDNIISHPTFSDKNFKHLVVINNLDGAVDRLLAHETTLVSSK